MPEMRPRKNSISIEWSAFSPSIRRRPNKKLLKLFKNNCDKNYRQDVDPPFFSLSAHKGKLVQLHRIHEFFLTVLTLGMIVLNKYLISLRIYVTYQF